MKMYYMLLLALKFYLFVCNGEKDVGSSCKRDSNVSITCTDLPDNIPRGTLKFRLNLDSGGSLVLNSTTFTTGYWRQLQYLYFTGEGKTHVVFSDNCFTGLEELKEIHINIFNPQLFHNTFSGLNNVKTLNFTECAYMNIEQFKLPMSGSNILPHLNKIVLTKLNSYYGSYPFDDRLVETLLPRHITDIDVSMTQLSNLNITAVCSKLTHLKVFNASYSTISDTYNRNLTQEDVKHIKMLDLSHATLPSKSLPIVRGKFVIRDISINFHECRFCNNEIVHIPGTVNISGIVEQFTSVWFYNVTWIIDVNPKWLTKTFKCQQNNLKYLDISVISDTYYFHSVQTIDLSDNGMEFIHPTLLFCMKNLMNVDLSKNQLFKMVNGNSFLFQNLFSGLKYIKIIRMSENGLHIIPNNLFKDCQLTEEIDLSYNRLEQVTFTLSDLEYLKVLDLKGNSIHTMDSHSITCLNSIPHGNNENVSSTTVILKSNPISCSTCRTKPFLRWLTSTKLIDTTEQKLKCLDENGRHADINSKTVEMVQEICERKTIIISTSILAAISPLLVLTCLVLIYRRYKQRRKKEKAANVIARLQNGQGQYKFAVFLSFSCQDEEFIRTHVLNQLNENLQLMTGIDRKLVCTGDEHFQLGHQIDEETFRLLESASVLVAVISNKFIDSRYCKSELENAYQEGKPIILMFVEEVEMNNMTRTMKSLYKRYTRILWTNENGEYVLKTTWENICISILELIKCNK